MCAAEQTAGPRTGCLRAASHALSAPCFVLRPRAPQIFSSSLSRPMEAHVRGGGAQRPHGTHADSLPPPPPSHATPHDTNTGGGGGDSPRHKATQDPPPSFHAPHKSRPPPLAMVTRAAASAAAASSAPASAARAASHNSRDGDDDDEEHDSSSEEESGDEGEERTLKNVRACARCWWKLNGTGTAHRHPHTHTQPQRAFQEGWLESFKGWLRWDATREAMFCTVCERYEGRTAKGNNKVSGVCCVVESTRRPPIVIQPTPPQTPKHYNQQFAGAGSRNFRLSALHDHEKAAYHKQALQQLKAARRYER